MEVLELFEPQRRWVSDELVDQRTRIKDINDKVYQASWDGKPEWNIDQANKNEVIK